MAFSAGNRYMVRHKLLHKALALSPMERAELAEMIAYLNPDFKEYDKKACGQLSRGLLVNVGQIQKIFKFYRESETFKHFCLDPKFPHVARWREILALCYHPDETLPALYTEEGRDEVVTIADHYFGAHFIAKYEKLIKGEEKSGEGFLSAKEYLDLACDECRSYNGLCLRAERNALFIEKNYLDPRKDRELTEAKAQLLQDGKTMGQFYGTLGYLRIAVVYSKLAAFFEGVSKEGARPLAQVFRELVFESFIKAKHVHAIEAFSQNRALIKAVCGEAELMAFGIRDWLSAEEGYTKGLEAREVNALRQQTERDLGQKLKVFLASKDGRYDKPGEADTI